MKQGEALAHALRLLQDEISHLPLGHKHRLSIIVTSEGMAILRVDSMPLTTVTKPTPLISEEYKTPLEIAYRDCERFPSATMLRDLVHLQAQKLNREGAK